MDKRFRNMAEYAYSAVPLYMYREKRLEEDTLWEDIPVLTKEEILKDPDRFYSCRFLNQEQKREVLYDRTSGSTGKYMELYWHKADARKSLLTVWLYRKKYYGINPSDRMCYFYTTSNMGYGNGIEYGDEEIGNKKGFSKNNLNLERLMEIYQQIREYQPVWMFLQPSMAVLLCDAAEKLGKAIPSLKYIEFTGEVLTDMVKCRTEQVFGCKTANQYGCNEVHTIAFECPCGNMHIARNNVYVEIVDDENNPLPDGKEGQILLTSAVNRITPFIRYRIGDRGLIRKSVDCKCGCKSPILEITRGRVHDYIELRDGTKVNAYVFVHAVEAVNIKYENCIRQFRIVQEDYEKFKVRLAVDEEVYELGVTEEIIAEEFVRNILQKELEGMEYEFEICEEIFPDGEKMLWFFKEIEKNENKEE